MKPILSSFFLVSLSVISNNAAAAVDRDSFAKEQRPVECVPVEAFSMDAPELELKVWARSPLIYSPVAMDTDAKGRLWVTEGIDYNSGPRVATGQSIIVLEDKDHDGTAESSHVFVTEKMRPAPLGIAVFDNRIVLSATPSIIVYTDVDRNARYDPAVDKREVFLTGFKNNSHDHSLHAVVGAPSGQWHFSFGNCGANINTKDGRHFISGCYYSNAEDIGKPSSDGHIYTGGMTMRVNPDGTGLTPTGQNMRNPHDMVVSSFGDVLQSDNDDPAHCRSSWVMENANMGYADLRDGSRSWEEVAKSWEEPKDFSRDKRFSASHWRENYPGASPPGTIYGAGSPTGNVLIEDDTLGLAGTYLVACMVRKEIMACQPKLNGTAIDMGKHRPFIKLKDGQQGQFFLPTDLLLGTDGSLFLSDFYNNTSRVTNQVSGTIYRITRKNGHPAKPAIDFTTTAGQLAALRNPAINIRSHAAALLVAAKDKAVTKDAVATSLAETGASPSLTARHLWVLAQLGEESRSLVLPYLDHADPQLKITAFRALRFSNDPQLKQHATKLVKDPSSAVRREIAVMLRDSSFADCREILAALFAGYDGVDRYYLEALGLAATGKEADCYQTFVAPLGDPITWSKTAKNLAWRLHTPEAIAALDTCIRHQKPPIDEFRHLAMAFASFRNDSDRQDRIKRLDALAALPEFSREDYQITVKEIIEKDLNDLKGTALTTSWLIPKEFGTKTNLSAPEVIAALPGDATRGKAAASSCLLCHRMEGNGMVFGPQLTQWGGSRTIEEIIKEIIDPDAKLAHGYEKPIRISSGKNVAEGIMTNYSWHAGSLKIKVLNGQTLKINFRETGAKVEELKESYMPSASEMGLTDQNVRDIAEYLKVIASQQASSVSSLNKSAEEKSPPDGTKEGWQVLTKEDFMNVNCHADTWKWVGGHAFCTGKPTGVIRYREPLENFELLCEWMHKEKGGNSGVFVWATPPSIASLIQGKGKLPHGIEVQVLDTGYAEVYTKQYNKPADWFTSHGDVFPVGPIKMRPFPPVAPDGKRSFPSKNTTKDAGQWNHYYIRAIDGEVRLWVNGEQVSGGDQISPAQGYLCLESEGAPVEFRNIRLRRLSPAATEAVPAVNQSIPTAKAISLKGHPIVGTWVYGEHSREFTEDGWCTLRSGTEVQWKRACISRSEKGLVLEGNLGHQLEGDTLHIEGKYQAKKK